MNKERRSLIRNLSKELVDIQTKLEYVLRKEEQAFDNIPENLEGTTRYEDSENAIEILEDVTDDLKDIVEQLGDIV